MLNELKTKDDAIDKLTLFISNYNEKCVISTYDAKTDSGRIEKAFIGFEYSNAYWKEGMHIYPDNSTEKIISQLYIDDNILDNQKVNYIFIMLSNNNIQKFKKS